MERDKIFALDWLGLAKKRVFGDVLRLFSFRYAWVKERNQKAYLELQRSCKAADPDIRRVAKLLLSELARDEKADGLSPEGSKDRRAS